MEKSPCDKGAAPVVPSKSPSASSSRRTSGSAIREQRLPTPPPDPREVNASNASASAASSNTNSNIFQYPPVKAELPAAFQSLLNYVEREKEFYCNLNRSIAQDCEHETGKEKPQAGESVVLRRESSTGKIVPPISSTEEALPSAAYGENENHQCECCAKIRADCEEFIAPLQTRLGSSISAALAAYGAVEQLTRMYSIWDQFLDLERKLQQSKECLRYVNLLQEKIENKEKDTPAITTSTDEPLDNELEQSIALLDTILNTGSNASLKRSQMKLQRERSKSVMGDDITSSVSRVNEAKGINFGNQLLRRQSTYCEGKSKVSKWTKVKAAFKWERANVPIMNEGSKDGLTPVNHEVARYLRVPSVPCGGGSSADSILSSSSGHFLSEAGTPGSISSASSMDDIDSSSRSVLRRDSSKSEGKAEILSANGNSNESTTSPTAMLSKCSSDAETDRASKGLPPVKSSSNKSLRRSKIVSDFEVLPEDVVAEIKSTTMPLLKRSKPPPSPLNLNLRQELNDLESFYSPHLLKSPKDGTQSLHRFKKINSPGNSSVPSSPSRHSDFFAEFESEDISSGDFSEPSSPNHLNSRKNFQLKQEEINRRYQILRTKLDMEFAAKRREWEKIKTNPTAARAINLISTPKSEEHSPNPVISNALSAKLLEENLTPDFKKKLKKWRVKKQVSLSAPAPQHPTPSPTSPHKDAKESSASDGKSKIDWNLWKTGQFKLEGQGLQALPEQKDLPEDFQKKLEEWNKIKRGGSTSGMGDSLKRSKQSDQQSKKSSDDDRNSAHLDKEKRASEKHKGHEKDKLEKLAKLKAIVVDHPVKSKEIEVKTSSGIMKFEGISRKFTRKLYEWEKARGIGPESSTFALLNPGFRPIDVGHISTDNKNENSPTLSRSLSLDSVSPNIALPAISHQASSLSLNDVSDLKDMDNTVGGDAASEFKKFEEPEAVMVEVEDHIVETASALITANNLVEKQTPVYKYEELACNDFCNSRKVQSFESHTNLAPLLSALKRTDELVSALKRVSPEISENELIRRCEATLSLIRNIYPYYTENLVKANVLNSISDVQGELSRIADLHQKSPLDEACCQEIMEERNIEYNEELSGLLESLELLRLSIQGGSNRYPRECVPDINITTDDAIDEASSVGASSSTIVNRDKLSPSADTPPEMSASQAENDIEVTQPSVSVQRTFSNANGSMVGKKRLRLRRMGSRQNSKTESDSSTDGENQQSALETPRRLKRKNFRLKQRSFDDDYRRSEEPASALGEDVSYILRVRPGYPIEQCRNAGSLDSDLKSKVLVTPTGSFAQLLTANQQRKRNTNVPENAAVNTNTNVFVKTKRKVFKTVEEPMAIGGIAVIEQELDNSQQSDDALEKQMPTGTSAQSIEEESLPLDDLLTSECNQSEDKEKEAETETVALVEVKFTVSLKKSLSETYGCCSDFVDVNIRRCYSAECIGSCSRQKHKRSVVRPPLATDSFRVKHKNFSTLTREKGSRQSEDSDTPREHRFKKNFMSKSKSNSRIESKIAKTNSGSMVDQQAAAAPLRDSKAVQKSTHRAPLAKPLSLQLEMTKDSNAFRSSPSALTTPEVEEPSSKPCTPLSERALRLRKAREDFLQSPSILAKPRLRRPDEIVRDEVWERNRRSDHSLSSVTTNEEASSLAKSFSEDTMRGGVTDTPTQSDAGTDADVAVGIYDSLPRTVTRSGKISSKLGFATLASKFRRVKGKSKSKEPSPTSTSGSGSALTALCRQSLLADAIAVPRGAHGPSGDGKPPLHCDSVMKSQSTPQARSHPLSSDTSLNKSQSEQYVRTRQKESYV